jgi:hypothetical protein
MRGQDLERRGNERPGRPGRGKRTVGSTMSDDESFGKDDKAHGEPRRRGQQQQGGEERRAGEDRRKAPRVPVEMWVEEVHENELYFQRTADLSVGGIFLEKTIPHPVGTVINLKIELPDGEEPFMVRGEIVSVGDDRGVLGMGVKFIDPPAAVVKAIQAFVDRTR